MFRTAVPSIFTTRSRLLSFVNTQTEIKSRTYHQLPTSTMKVKPGFLLTVPSLIASFFIGRYRGLLPWRARQYLQSHSAA